MTGSIQIMDAARTLALDRITALKQVYFDAVPVGFLRPSMLIEAGEETLENANAELVKEKLELKLTVFTELDAYGECDAMELLRLRQSVMDLFRPGFLQTDDRAIPVQEIRCERDGESAWITVVLEYFDLRTEDQDSLPLMETVKTTIELKG